MLIACNNIGLAPQLLYRFCHKIYTLRAKSGKIQKWLEIIYFDIRSTTIYKFQAEKQNFNNNKLFKSIDVFEKVKEYL